MNMQINVLIVEDSEDDAKLELLALRRGGFDPTYRRVQSAEELATALAQQRWDAVISDYAMPGFTGLDALRMFRSTGLDIPFILISGTIGEEIAVAAMKAGASDYVMKASLTRLAPALERELKEAQMRAALKLDQQALTESEERFREMAENIRDVFILRNADGSRMLYVSPAYEEIFGRTCESLYANPESWFEAIHPDDRSSIYEKYKNGLLVGRFELEFRALRPDGSIRWIESRGFPVRDAAGELVRIAGIAKDITESKRAAQELRESERRFKDMLGNVELISTMLDRDARITFCNEYLLRVTGWRLEEVIGRNWFDLFAPPENIDLKEKFFAALLADLPETWHHESEILTRSGERRLVCWNNSALRSGAGDVIGTASIGEDITERKHAEHALARLVAIIEATPDMVATADLDGHVLYYNRAGRRMLGFEPGLDLSTIRFLDTHPEWAAKLVAETGVPYAIEHGTWSAETALLSRDGREIPVSQVIIAHKGPDGSVEYLSTIARDITLQKENEKRILRLNRVYAVLSGINETIVRTSKRQDLFNEACRIAVEAGKFRLAWIGLVDANGVDVTPVARAGVDEGYLDNIHLTARDDAPDRCVMVARALLEKTAMVCNDIDTDPQMARWREEALRRGYRSVAVFPLQLEDKVAGLMLLYASEAGFFDTEEMRLLTDIAGDISFALAHQHAIDRSIGLEHARNDADMASQAKSSFLAHMSHEIRTPMNGVIGMVDVLRQTSLSDYQVEMVDLIHESAFSLLTIIDDILDFSKIEAARLEIESTPISVADVVEKACGMLDHFAVKKGVELTMFIDPAIPETVLGDELRLRQVVLNLVSNAIKFSSGREQAGRVSVRVVPTERSAEEAVVEIHVIDNGIGMDEKTQARLFTAFTQADTSTTRRFGGTGLGLVISRHLVELMHGYFMLHSAPGKGSTFTLRLPFALLQSKADVVKPASDVAGLSCLAVGGPDGLAENIAAYLAHDGARVERAADLAQARTLMLGMPAGLWIWIVDCADIPTPITELRALADGLPEQEIRFVAIRRGSRREPHARFADLVLIDGNVLARRRLLKAVAIAAGRAFEEESPPPSGKPEAAFTPPSRDEALRNGRLILVAEDNETNQKVILRLLALLGFAADIVDNGSLALECWQSGDYALLLSDLHMPEMDGYELTAAIRTREKRAHRMPIVAMTADTVKDIADRCRAAGMDDYLSKPFQLAELKAVLQTWLPTAAFSLSSHAEDVPQAAAAKAVDVRVLEALVGNDRAVILEFLNDFRISAAKIARELETACADGQAVQASRQAHKLKSSARTVGALALGELCAKIETAGKAGSTETLTALLPMLELELDAVNAFLDSFPAQRADRRHDE